jgi:hypothetical protein
MATYTGEQIKTLFKEDPKKTSHLMMAAIMLAYGQPNASDLVIEHEIKAQLAGADPNPDYGFKVQKFLKDGFII